MAMIVDLNPRATTSYGMPYDILVFQSTTQAREMQFDIYEKRYEDRYLGMSQRELSSERQAELHDIALREGSIIPIMSLSAEPPQEYLVIPFVSADGNTYAIHTDVVEELAEDWNACIDVAHRFLDCEEVPESDRTQAVVNKQAFAAALRIHGGGILALQLFYVMALVD